ncbi:MAG: FmdE family protein [Chloroflexia bacterium]
MSNVNELEGLEELLRKAGAMHSHICPRQVIGVRSGMLAARLFWVELPQKDKRLFAFVETDGCFADGVAVASGCALGKRTMRLVDYGKVAVTFVDTVACKAVRVCPNPAARERAWKYAPGAPDSWHAQLEGYKQMPTCELLLFEEVRLVVPIDAIISKPGLRAICEVCGEEIMNGREVVGDEGRKTKDEGRQARVVCRYCAGLDRYYDASDI